MGICIHCNKDKDKLVCLTCNECIEKINKRVYGKYKKKDKNMKFEDIKNESGREFKSIEKEAWRDYTYSNGTILRVDNPIALSISGSGHYVVDSEGVVNFFPNDFIRLRWQGEDGGPDLSF